MSSRLTFPQRAFGVGMASSPRLLHRHPSLEVPYASQASPPTKRSGHLATPPSRGSTVSRRAFDGGDKGGKTAVQFNPVYAAICGGYAALMLFQNPYIFAALTILTIIPQNSSTTSLNSLVLLFYDSGLFINFAGESSLMPCRLEYMYIRFSMPFSLHPCSPPLQRLCIAYSLYHGSP